MSSQPAPQNNEDATPKEQSTPPSSEEKLVQELEDGGLDQQNQLSFQAALALVFGASTHALEIKSSLDLLRGEIDIDKLITDPRYKAQIERAVQLTNRYGRIVKKGDLEDIIPRTQQALARVEILHGQTGQVKKSMSAQYEIELRSTYRLNDDQINNIREKALAKIKENPSLSMRDALRIEAREFFVKTVEKEVKDDKSVNWSKRKEEVEKRLDAKDKQFLEHPQTAKVYDVEKELCDKINNRGVEAIKQSLGREHNPPPGPPSTPPPPIPPPSLIIPSGPIPRFNLPSFSLPSGLTQGLSNVFRGMGNGLGSFFRSGGLLSNGLSGGLNLLKNAGLRGLGALAPPLLAAQGALAAIDLLTGGMGSTLLKALIIGVVVVIIGLPLIIGVGVFSSITGDKPMIVTSTNYRDLGWNEFNNQYLTINLNNNLDKLRAGDTNQTTWQQFEKDYLVLQKQYLSFEKLNP